MMLSGVWQADRELASNGKSPEKLKAAGSFLMKVFGVLAVCFSLPMVPQLCLNLYLLVKECFPNACQAFEGDLNL